MSETPRTDAALTDTLRTDILLIGTDDDVVADLATVLDAERELMPTISLDGSGDGLDWGWAAPLEAWRSRAGAGPPSGRVVVVPWAPPADNTPVGELDLAGWTARAEVAMARWAAALGVARSRCDDGGAIVAVVDRPAPLDCAGWAPETGMADAVEAFVRSLARSEGPRGVRVNAVTTPARLSDPSVVDPPPPLAAFPGSVLREVPGAVRMLLGADAVGITGTVVHADCGRSWR